ncbi:hypothetical protein HMPREF0580_2105 [Mobiluncus mulieris ATCC 35239]|uniref:Uncharacterized protein n=3 Tax=Mobiluncus mulieris TaxID=2052 RepID=E0QT90_9ACTO|nr:hypothetical protein HMPREF0580_2105 [Mobiluncus mulieris ATCC 35239]EFN93942.1 hypothetical protein HMPREF9278_0752 [Mobiluncus mulieris FB024-16]MCU9994336.1 hypothetical protein [Mobiluncus mulieris]MCV0014339.1 hypothetical protein [Mobiluncus mulieris]NMW63716.1 hypothetical protein [Mobiluncus mulieris]
MKGDEPMSDEANDASKEPGAGMTIPGATPKAARGEANPVETTPTAADSAQTDPADLALAATKPSPEEAAQLLELVDQTADRVVTLQRFPRWWLTLYMLLPAAIQSLPLLLENEWVYVATVAGGILGTYALLTLMWPKLIRTGLGQDERLRLQSLFLLPLVVGGTATANILWESKGDSPWLLASIVFVAVAVVLGFYAQVVLHWYRVRVLARAFDFTESEEIWDSAREEVRRRIAAVKTAEKAKRRGSVR